eukprot:scaffold5146_cov134-Skeletonema_marinoi.AAC.2
MRSIGLEHELHHAWTRNRVAYTWQELATHLKDVSISAQQGLDVPSNPQPQMPMRKLPQLGKLHSAWPGKFTCCGMCALFFVWHLMLSLQYCETLPRDHLDEYDAEMDFFDAEDELIESYLSPPPLPVSVDLPSKKSRRKRNGKST